MTAQTSYPRIATKYAQTTGVKGRLLQQNTAEDWALPDSLTKSRKNAE
jgi:hypothetical protein